MQSDGDDLADVMFLLAAVGVAGGVIALVAILMNWTY